MVDGGWWMVDGWRNRAMYALHKERYTAVREDTDERRTLPAG